MDSTFVNDHDFIPPTEEDMTAPFTTMDDDEYEDSYAFCNQARGLFSRYNIRNCAALAAAVILGISLVVGMVVLARNFFRD